jgi:hypothetical protein
VNAVEIEEAISALAAEPFDSAEFSYAFLEAFGNKATTIKRLRTGNNNKSDIENGVLQYNNIHMAIAPEGQVKQILDALRTSPATTKQKAKFILATDGEWFEAEDLATGETIACNYSDFPNHFGFFLALAGISTVKEIRDSSIDIRATSRLNKLYVELLNHNPEWGTAERRHDMNHFMARLIFCFYAEDTDIFAGDNLFTGTVERMSANDFAVTHEVIGEIFRAMNTRKENHETEGIKRWANQFPYVNGGLFSGSTEAPKFSKIARSYLLHVGNLDWKQINPDIFGSMIQAVADDEERGALGMHYTSVPNILKVLNPLFLDDLRAQLEEAGDNVRKLLNLRKRMSRIRVFDPACGSGNFLVIAYKQMREIEYEINKRRGEEDIASEIPLTNFRGIELRDFSAEIARLALIIAEYQCDVLYRGQKLALAEFLPLNAENWITSGNALRLDWLSICPPTGTGVKLQGDDLFSTPLDQAQIDFENEGGETYICGNPPYAGATVKPPKGASKETKERLRKESEKRKADLKTIFEDRIKKWKSLDYVAGWFAKAVEYGKQTNAATAFVSTNSICQGQQVPILWPLIFRAKHEINFAHTSFKWANLASKNAGVTVVIVGISNQPAKRRRLFSIDSDGSSLSRNVDNINAYLVNGPNVIVEGISNSKAGKAELHRGNQPTDGGHLLLTPQDLKEISVPLDIEKRLIKKIFGSAEFIQGKERLCLWIEDHNLSYALEISWIKKRVEAVKKLRLESSDKGANEMAARAHQFREMHQATGHSIIVPKVSSASREYLPAGFLPPQSIVSDSAFALYDAPLWNMAIIVSRLHLIWIATICGKLKTDYRYSNSMGWNTFPVPKLTEKNKEDLTRCAEDILLARETHFPATIAELYEVKDGVSKMPENLRRAHDRNDEVLERIYIGRRFKNDTERLEKLFELYTKMTSKKAAA